MCIEKCLHFKRKCRHHPHPILDILPVYLTRGISIFFLSALSGSGLELVIGWFLDFLWNLRYWDYSGYFLNFRGYICLASAFGFGVAGVLWVCIFSKILQKWWYHISLDFRKKWNMFWVFIFVIDCAAALIFPNTGHSITF